ncbi:unnamed protein product, partial [Prunus brigantina]
KIITSSRFQVRYLQNLLGENPYLISKANSKLRKTQAPTSNSSKNIITTLSLSFFFSLPIWSSRFLSKLYMPFSRCVNHLYMQLSIYTRNKAATISLSLVDMFGGWR